MKNRHFSTLFLALVLWAMCSVAAAAATMQPLHATTNGMGDTQSPAVSGRAFSENPLTLEDEWYNRAYNQLWKTYGTKNSPQSKPQQDLPRIPVIDFKGRESVVLADPKALRLWFHWKPVAAPKIRIEIFDITGERIATLHQKQPRRKVGWNLSHIHSGIFYYRLVLLDEAETALPLRKIVVFR